MLLRLDTQKLIKMMNKLFYKGTNMYLKYRIYNYISNITSGTNKITEFIFQIYIPIVYQKTNK